MTSISHRSSDGFFIPRSGNFKTSRTGRCHWKKSSGSAAGPWRWIRNQILLTNHSDVFTTYLQTIQTYLQINFKDSDIQEWNNKWKSRERVIARQNPKIDYWTGQPSQICPRDYRPKLTAYTFPARWTKGRGNIKIMPSHLYVCSHKINTAPGRQHQAGTCLETSSHATRNATEGAPNDSNRNHQ